MKTIAGVAIATALALVPATLSAQILTPQRRQAIIDSAPSCSEHPDYPFIGRVSGGADDILDRKIPVSFVGCFPDFASCEKWKGATSGIITTTLIQFSCKPR